ncbi:MAG TPA: hypothetical protein VG168_04730 [Bryobacteraceae bacterium]|nr:hypothetical protein [Bryobacteraceae bacterium]
MKIATQFRRGGRYVLCIVRHCALPLCFLSLAACLVRSHDGTFRVISDSPAYLLKSPDSRKTPFPNVLKAYNGFEPAQRWIDLRPLMELRIENAYYEKGASRRGLAGYLGTEVAHYEITAHGLRLLSVHPMKDRPEGQMPVQRLIRESALAFPCYRFYYELVFARGGDSHGSALLGADSMEELNALSRQLDQAETVCSAASPHCTVFPEACSVSVEMRIVVNGKPQTVFWGSLLASIAARPHHLEMRRLYAGRLRPVKINFRDPGALRLPLLPGDEITWN